MSRATPMLTGPNATRVPTSHTASTDLKRLWVRRHKLLGPVLFDPRLPGEPPLLVRLFFADPESSDRGRIQLVDHRLVSEKREYKRLPADVEREVVRAYLAVPMEPQPAVFNRHRRYSTSHMSMEDWDYPPAV